MIIFLVIDLNIILYQRFIFETQKPIINEKYIE